MDEPDQKAFREAFLAANANEDFIAAQLADMLRDLMRAVSSDDISAKAWSAGEQMTFICELVARLEPPLPWHRLLHGAVLRFKGKIPDDPDDRKFIDAAKIAVKYLVESSATDNAAKRSRFVLAFDRGADDLVIRGLHAVELQLRHGGQDLGSFHQMGLLKLS